MRKNYLVSMLLALPLWCSVTLAQEPVQVGRGSYAEYAPLAKSRTSEHAGDQSQYMQYRKLYIKETPGTPIPTNDWWTDLINADRGRSGQEVTGHLWSYPQYVQGMKYGVDIHYPKYWVDNGTEMKAQSKLTVKGSNDFLATTPLAEEWSDWTVTFSETSGTQRMVTTLAHGVPFTWIEMENVEPIISVAKTDNDGADNLLKGTVSVDFLDGTGTTPITTGIHTQFIVKISNAQTADLYGVYLPEGSTVTIDGKNASVAFAGTKKFVVVALLKTAADLNTYAAYAYSKPTNTQVSWNYAQAAGTLTTRWQVTAEDLRTGSSTTNVLQGFIPHHWRNRYATYSHSFMGQEYDTPRGKIKLAAGNDLSISYKFTGILPWYALPNDLTGDHAYDVTKMKTMLEEYAQKGTFGNDTYWGGKGLTQMALYMSFAREMGEEELFRQCHDRLKEALVNWMTYTPGESDFFFARDRRFGGLIGYNTSYDSDTYNDHHFHYGYFTLAAAMLCLVDDDFKTKYGDMLKLVARDYNNYKRDSWACFLRMMDPWAGHCYAGGMGDGAGNGQESTSESMQGWGGMYLLGVALGDNELRDAGIFGWVSESRATAEYWFDRHGETIGDDFHTTKTADYNIDYSKFKHTGPDYIIPYSSNLTSHGVGWWTWFGGDPVFMQGIQWMPISPALDYLGEDKAFAAWDYNRLMALKEHIGWDGTGGKGDNPGDLRDSDWGNVVLAYRQWSDPDDAAAIFDEGWANNWGTMKTSLTNGITYFATHSHRSYGDIQWDITADCPTARVYKKGDVKTHVAYNPTDASVTVSFSDGFHLEVPARQLKVEGVTSTAYNYVYPVDDSEPDIRERLVMKNLALNRPCTESSHENDETVKENATDGKENTRWGSNSNDNEWIQVDLGENASIYKVRVKWETAYASEYRIELRSSENGAVLFSKTGNGKPNAWTELEMSDHEGRYVRLVGVKRGTQYGTSLYELEVYGKLASTPNTELMGVEIGSAKSVLKQNEANALTIKGYDYAKNPKDVTATWSSEDGAFNGSNFTPSKYGMVTVKAAVEGLTASKELPVEEALKVSSLNLIVPVGMVVGSEYAYEVEAKDQFGAVMAATPTVSGEGLTIDTEHHTITPTVVGQYEIAATMGSIQTSSPVLVLSSAPAVPEASAIGVPVFVRQEEPSMNFDYNGGSKQVGSTFMIVDNCPVVYVEKLGTFGMGALGNIDLEGANMIHADIYPLADAPDFSIHIEGAPGNKEYAKSLKGGQWNSVDLPVSNTTANWLFFAFSNYQAGTGKALVANVYFYTETGDKVFVGSPDSKGMVTVTSLGAGLTDATKAQFLSDIAALPATTTAIDLSGVTLGNSTAMTITTANPNVIILLSGSGGDDDAASTQQTKLTNTQNLAYTTDQIWYLPLKATNFKVVFEDGYPVLPVNFGRNTTLTYSRTLLAGNYGTSCLPCDVAIPSGLTAYELTSVEADGLHFSTVTTGTMLANKPYLLYNSTAANIELNINGKKGNAELGRNVGELSTTVDGVRMIGNYKQFRVTGSEGYAAFKSSGQLAWLSQSGAVVASFRAYLADAPATARIFVDDEPTGIYSIENGQLTIENDVYDLQGRRVGKWSKANGQWPMVNGQLKPGIYIVNGKKIVIK